MVQRLYIVFALVFAIPQLALALVDMRNANYSDTWTDLQVRGPGYNLSLKRSYNSRTLYNGMFGFGWCTDYETKLEVTPENNLRITQCGAGAEVEFTHANVSGDVLNQNIKTILAEVRSRNKDRDEAYFKGIENDLRIDPALRDEFAKQLKITGKINKDAHYLANGRVNDFVVFNGTEYLHHMPVGTIEKFNSAGRLIQISDKSGNFLKITLKNDKIINVVNNSGASLQFKYADNTKYVSQVIGPANLSASYKYKGEMLASVTNASKGTFKHEYDDLYNITKITFPDKTNIELTYNQDKDWVTSFKDRAGCKETYEYKDDEEDAVNNYSSNVIKVCNKKVTNRSSYSFWHKTRKDGARYLARSLTNINGHEEDIYYHEVYGRPSETIKDGRIQTFEYFADGQMKTRTDDINEYSYKYDTSCHKVSQLVQKVKYFSVAENFDKKGRNPSETENQKPKQQIKTFLTDFTYDKKSCNLISAKNNQGQLANISYDSVGRMTKILDQSKRLLTISYEERFGKPYIVNRPGLGTIKFKYKADGSIEKYESDENSLVAIQVASIFNNLLEIIAPATTESNNI